MKKISLAMIVRDCAEDLDTCLSSVAGYPDEIVILDTGSKDNTKEVARKYTDKVYEMEWPGRFDVARNRSFELTSNEFVMWLDSDDVVIDPETLFAEFRGALDQGVDVIVCAYDYEFSRDSGECTTRLRRERVVRKSIFSWASPIHECLCSPFAFSLANVPPSKGYIRHNRIREDRERTKASLERNMEIFERELRDHGLETRGYYYYGNTLVGLNRPKEAIEAWEKYCSASEVVAEVYSARCAQSEASRMIGDLSGALDYASKAIALNPEFPTAWLQLAEAYLMQRNFEGAKRCAEHTLKNLEAGNREAVWNPLAVQGRPHFILAYCLANMNDMNAAMRHAEVAKKFFPSDERLKEIIGRLEEAMDKHNVITSFNILRSYAQQTMGDAAKDKLLSCVPESLRWEPELVKHFHYDRPADKPSIGIYCPLTSETWGPGNHRTGIGGSEEAVICVSRELVELGWHVEVYAYTSHRGYDDAGVFWYPFFAWRGDRNELDIEIVWRVPNGPISTGSNAKATYLWLHDMPDTKAWAVQFQEAYRKVMFLSEFHRKNYPWVVDEKVMMTRNGILTDQLSDLAPERERRNRYIYASCPSRGLVNILKEWETIRGLREGSELDIFYGWSPLANMRVTRDRDFAALYREIEELREQPGVNWHGRVGQEELNIAFSKAGWWLYPTAFPEISCITAMRAQAHGCIPICTDDFALSETVFTGLKVPGDMNKFEFRSRWLSGLRDLVANRYMEFDDSARSEIAVEARRRFNWSGVARQWDAEFREAISCSPERRTILPGQLVPAQSMG